MGKAKKISNTLLIIIIVSAFTVTVFAATLLIAPRIKKNGDTAANFFVALFKDPPDTSIENEVVAEQSSVTGTIKLKVNAKTSYKKLQIKVSLIDAAAYNEGQIKVLTYTDANNQIHNEEYIFTFNDIEAGEALSNDRFTPSAKTLEIKSYYIIKDVVYYE